MKGVERERSRQGERERWLFSIMRKMLLLWFHFSTDHSQTLREKAAGG